MSAMCFRRNVRFAARRLADCRLAILLLLSITCALPTAARAQTASSPTGRTPRLIWTPERQAVWNRLVAENHPWWQRLRGYADGSVALCGDVALAATMAYQWTGDVTYARRAWGLLQPSLTPVNPPPFTRDDTRENFISLVWMYDWLYPALSSSERATFITYLNWIGDLVLNKVPGVNWGTSTSDSDETIGHYFGLAFLDLVTGPDNPRAGTFLSSTWVDSYVTVKPVGGLDATGVNRDTLRNTIRQFVEMAKGGMWFESSGYNLGTPKLLLLGAEGVRTATGVDHFPEITALTPQLGLMNLQQLTPGVTDSYQWGDEQWPHSLLLYHRLPQMGILAGLLQRDSTIGPYVQQFVQEQFPNVTSFDIRAIALFNPYAPAADWRGVLPKGYTASGQGMLFLRTGWDSASSFFGTHVQPNNWVDHQINYLGDFQLYRKGEWAVTHPHEYGGEQGDQAGLVVNGMLVAGLTTVRETRGLTAQEVGPDGRYAYQSGGNGGQWAWLGYFDPPPTYLHEWTRGVLYLPSQDGKSDTIVVHDRVDAEDPQQLTSFDRYYPDQRNCITSAPALKQWVIHMPVAPTVDPSGLSWQTPGGQQVRVIPLAPADWRAQTYDESQISLPGSWYSSEKKWQARITPGANRRWDTFLNVVQASDPGAVLSTSLVRSDGGEVEGALLRRGGHSDAVVLFSALQGPAITPTQPVGSYAVFNPSMLSALQAKADLASGFILRFTGSTPSTDVYLLGLDSSRTWAATCDGVGVPVSVSDQGVGRCTVTGTGAHVLTVGPGGAPPATYRVSGTVTLNGSGLGAVKVSVGSTSATTAADGSYSVGSLPAGTYSVSAALAGYDLGAPKSVTVGPDQTSVNFTAAAATFLIGGKVTNAGNALAGATVTVGAATATTGADGTYLVDGLAAGTYTVTAADPGYAFGPAKTVSVGPSQTGVDFATVPTYSIGGKVTRNGQGLGGVSVSAGSAVGTTAPNGSYRIDGLVAGTYSVSASKNGFTFGSARSVTVGPNQTAVDFIATVATYRISGKVSVDGTAQQGVAVRAGTRRTVTASNGTYLIRGLQAGSYVVSASKAGFAYGAPRTVGVGPDQAGVDFTGAAQTYTIAGRVTVGGSGMAAVGVTAAAGGTSYSAVTGVDGTYAITGVASGKYRVSASAPATSFGVSRSVSVGPDARSVNFVTRNSGVPRVASIVINPGRVGTGRAAATAAIQLSGRSPGCNIALASSNPQTAAVPAIVWVPAGQQSVSVSIETEATTYDATVTITASSGGAARSAKVVVLRSP